MLAVSMAIDRTYLIIGPSGVGKSSAIQLIDSREELSKFTLDSVIKAHNDEPSCSKYFDKIGNEMFFKKSIESIGRLTQENSGKNILIDVGAGSFDWEGCTDTFLKYQIISLTGDKEVLHKRILNRQGEKRNFEQYVGSEFKPHKTLLYEKAMFRIDTTKLDSKDVAEQIIQIVTNASS